MLKKILIFILIVYSYFYINYSLKESFQIINIYTNRIFPRHYTYYPDNHYWYSGMRDWYYKSMCKRGCVNIGNNKWGCQYPGNSYNDCVFSYHCSGC